MQLDAAAATMLVRQHVDPRLTVADVRELHGGMIHRVYELLTDGDPSSLVAKVNEVNKAALLQRECDVLLWYRAHVRFPVPRPIACFGPTSELPLAGLLMERVPGTNLADARLSPRGKAVLQKQLAGHVAALHANRRETYGSALDDVGHARWVDAFRPTMLREFEAAKDLISSRARSTVASVIERLDEWLPERNDPRLVHGDLWATNILVDDAHPDRPRITAFIDCGASYCDPEYELAYLRVFHTASDAFYTEYARHHPIASGFDRRCRIYWLNTIMMHIRVFGDQYIPRCETLAEQIRRIRE